MLFNKPGDAEPGLGIKPLKKTKTGYSTDVEVLEKLASDPSVESPVPGLIVEYRQLTKLVGTYLTALKEAINPRTGRVHASFNQTVAATGRLSSSEPNLQNIPIRTEIGREIRRAFVAEEGHVLIGADYSQIELRVLAHMSGDANLIEAFNEGQDIHRAVAAQIHGVDPEDVTGEQRSGAKMVNFGIVYGITPYGLARRLGREQRRGVGDHRRVQGAVPGDHDVPPGVHRPREGTRVRHDDAGQASADPGDRGEEPEPSVTERAYGDQLGGAGDGGGPDQAGDARPARATEPERGAPARRARRPSWRGCGCCSRSTTSLSSSARRGSRKRRGT